VGTDAPRTRRHRSLKFLVGLLITVLVLAVVAAGLGWWTVNRSFPTMSGRIDVEGLTQSVTVYRDDAGVPQLVAETADDLFFGQGYVHAQDRFWEMDFRRHVTSGRLSELFGESQLGTDTFIRTLGWRQVAEQEVELLGPEARSYYESYAAGVNAYLDERRGADLSLEHAVLGLQNPGYQPEPWTPADSISWLKAMAWDLRSNLEEEIDRALLASELQPEEVARLHPSFPYGQKPTILGGSLIPAGEAASVTDAHPLVDPAIDQSLLAAALDDVRRSLDILPELLGPAGGEIGSNSWVVSGALTDTGSPLLANDPHLGPVMPSVWYQMSLRCAEVTADCPFAVSGYTFSGMPGVIIGHNDQIAWGFTNLGPDVADLFVEKVSGDEYELDGALLAMTVRTEEIAVAGGDPVEIEIRSTGRGPILTGIQGAFERITEEYPAAIGLDEAEYALSLRWTALTPGRTAEAVFEFNAAAGWDEFRAAARLFEVPSQNLVYADIGGNIGYQAPGRIPIRSVGDGTVPLPGWTSENRWTGYVPHETMPSLFNPESGYIVTANNAVNGPDETPMLTRDWDLGYRAERIDRRLRELVDAGTPITNEAMSRIQADTFSANAAQFLPILTELGADGDAARGIELLADWDAHADADSASAAYFAMFWHHLLHAMFEGKLPEGTEPAGSDRFFSIVGTLLAEPESPWWTNGDATGRDEMLAAALEAAWQEGEERMGSDPTTWRWGRLHTLTIRNGSFGESGVGAIEWLFNRGPYEVGGGSSIVNAIGWDAWAGYEVDWVPSMRMVVDLGDFDESTWINLTGASGHAFHPNYADQTPLWQNDETRPWPHSLEAVQAAATNTLVLVPAGH
jgi:penicillin G amidase